VVLRPMSSLAADQARLQLRCNQFPARNVTRHAVTIRWRALPRLATSAPRSTLTAFKQCQVWAEGRALRRWVRVIEPA